MGVPVKKLEEARPILDKALLRLLVCPRDREALEERDEQLLCPNGHHYAIVEGIPILLLSETEQTHVEGTRSLQMGTSGRAVATPLPGPAHGEIDSFVQHIIAATNGLLYIRLVGKLREYPIPYLRLPPGNGKRFLEIGCNWGRWCVAAARLGYRPVGIDPSLKGIRAARHVAEQLGIDAHYVVADGRYLPFASGSFDQVFSYSVLQHLSKENARLTLREIARALQPDGGFLVQMPNCFGIRCLYHQARRGFSEGNDFDVRYWTPRELASTFRAIFGSARILVDGFFSLNPQISDVGFMPWKYRSVVYASEALRKISGVFSPLSYFAGSLCQRVPQALILYFGDEPCVSWVAACRSAPTCFSQERSSPDAGPFAPALSAGFARRQGRVLAPPIRGVRIAGNTGQPRHRFLCAPADPRPRSAGQWPSLQPEDGRTFPRRRERRRHRTHGRRDGDGGRESCPIRRLVEAMPSRAIRAAAGFALIRSGISS